MGSLGQEQITIGKGGQAHEGAGETGASGWQMGASRETFLEDGYRVTLEHLKAQSTSPKKRRVEC